MRREKIFRNKDGSRTKVVVKLIANVIANNCKWKSFSYRCEKGKRTWVLSGATDDQIREAKLEMWQLIKPKLED